jgi:hypothetical protein
MSALTANISKLMPQLYDIIHMQKYVVQKTKEKMDYSDVPRPSQPSHKLANFPQPLKNINALNASFRENIINWTNKDSLHQSSFDTVVAVQGH